jgi:hypothetical protein
MRRATNIILTNDSARLARPDSVTALAEDVVARATKAGNCVSRTTARNTAVAATYLLGRNLRMPVTQEEARSLDSEALRQCRVFCAGWKEWADAAARGRCTKIIEMLMAVEREATAFKSRRAREPICGWSNGQQRSVYTKRQWREAA